MGWKTFKDYFEIDHMVFTIDDYIVIADTDKQYEIVIDGHGSVNSFSLCSHSDEGGDVIDGTSIYFANLLVTLLTYNKSTIVKLIKSDDVFTNVFTRYVDTELKGIQEYSFDNDLDYFVTIDGELHSPNKVLSDKLALELLKKENKRLEVFRKELSSNSCAFIAIETSIKNNSDKIKKLQNSNIS